MGEDETSPAPSGIAVSRRILAGEPLEGAFGSCATCSQMARLAVYRAAGGFDPAFRRGEDTELNVRLAAMGAHFPGVRTPLVVQTMTMSTEKSLDTELALTKSLLGKHRALFRSEEDYQFAQQWLAIKFLRLQRRNLRFLGQLLRLAISRPLAVARRIWYALPHADGRRAMSQFHAKGQQR